MNYSTCIVSAYFNIPSKNSHEWYIDYILNFFNFRNTSVPLVFFSTGDLIDFLKAKCNTENVAFIETKFEEIDSWREFGEEFWKRQYERDPERYHSPQLGAIWCNKKNFVLRATELFEYDVYIWCDAGCVRDVHSCRLFRDFGTRKHINLNDNKIHFGQVQSELPPYSTFYKFPAVAFACGLSAGNKQSWEKYKEIYDIVLKTYDKNKISGISDQYITLTCFNENGNLFEPIKDTSICDQWMKCLQFF